MRLKARIVNWDVLTTRAFVNFLVDFGRKLARFGRRLGDGVSVGIVRGWRRNAETCRAESGDGLGVSVCEDSVGADVSDGVGGYVGGSVIGDGVGVGVVGVGVGSDETYQAETVTRGSAIGDGVGVGVVGVGVGNDETQRAETVTRGVRRRWRCRRWSRGWGRWQRGNLPGGNRAAGIRHR